MIVNGVEVVMLTYDQVNYDDQVDEKEECQACYYYYNGECPADDDEKPLC